jgi:hypothetical protein
MGVHRRTDGQTDREQGDIIRLLFFKYGKLAKNEFKKSPLCLEF